MEKAWQRDWESELKIMCSLLWKWRQAIDTSQLVDSTFFPFQVFFLSNHYHRRTNSSLFLFLLPRFSIICTLKTCRKSIIICSETTKQEQRKTERNNQRPKRKSCVSNAHTTQNNIILLEKRERDLLLLFYIFRANVPEFPLYTHNTTTTHNRQTPGGSKSGGVGNIWSQCWCQMTQLKLKENKDPN